MNLTHDEAYELNLQGMDKESRVRLEVEVLFALAQRVPEGFHAATSKQVARGQYDLATGPTGSQVTVSQERNPRDRYAFPGK